MMSETRTHAALGLAWAPPLWVLGKTEPDHTAIEARRWPAGSAVSGVRDEEVEVDHEPFPGGEGPGRELPGEIARGEKRKPLRGERSHAVGCSA